MRCQVPIFSGSKTHGVEMACEDEKEGHARSQVLERGYEGLTADSYQ